MNMWHDTEIEPTSAGVSHSAPAEVEVTSSSRPQYGLFMLGVVVHKVYGMCISMVGGDTCGVCVSVIKGEIYGVCGVYLW